MRPARWKVTFGKDGEQARTVVVTTPGAEGLAIVYGKGRSLSEALGDADKQLRTRFSVEHNMGDEVLKLQQSKMPF